MITVLTNLYSQYIILQLDCERQSNVLSAFEKRHVRTEIKMPNSYHFLGCQLLNASVTNGDSLNCGTILPFLHVMGGNWMDAAKSA